MFTFQPVELLIVFVGGLALFAGIALLMLRRRNEILQQYLTPDEPELEEEFFRKPDPAAPTEMESDEDDTENSKTNPQSSDSTVANELAQNGWGNSADDTASKDAAENTADRSAGSTNAENTTNEQTNANQNTAPNPVPAPENITNQ
ncbi:hypothetical protein FACS189454_08820 [Planctomycetales bacterium]|nr:hypothetical protein FACS189454_08820 [Planctomycetales bacterium]